MNEILIARLNDRCQPLDRGDLYEDPLAEALEAAGLGEVTGGGSSFSPKGGIDFVDIEIALSGDLEAGRKLVVEKLVELGAPKGSRLVLDDGQEVPFGKREGVAFYFNIIDVPTDIKDRFPLQDLADEFVEKLQDLGEMSSSWSNEQWVSVYFFGASYEEMASVLSPYINEHPRCAGGRIERIA